MSNTIPAYGGGTADTPSGSNAPLNDRLNTDAPASTHWHVQRHAEDSVHAAEDIFAALDYAGDALAERAGFEHEGITIAGESGDTQLAYERFKNSERFGNLADNAKVITRNHGLRADSPNRAPLYRGDSGDPKLLVAATNQVDRINLEGPIGFLVYECALDECAPEDTEDTEDVYDELISASWSEATGRWRVHGRESVEHDWTSFDGSADELDELWSLARDLVTGG